MFQGWNAGLGCSLGSAERCGARHHTECDAPEPDAPVFGANEELCDHLLALPRNFGEIQPLLRAIALALAKSGFRFSRNAPKASLASGEPINAL